MFPSVGFIAVATGAAAAVASVVVVVEAPPPPVVVAEPAVVVLLSLPHAATRRAMATSAARPALRRLRLACTSVLCTGRLGGSRLFIRWSRKCRGWLTVVSYRRRHDLAVVSRGALGGPSVRAPRAHAGRRRRHRSPPPGQRVGAAVRQRAGSPAVPAAPLLRAGRVRDRERRRARSHPSRLTQLGQP